MSIKNPTDKDWEDHDLYVRNCRLSRACMLLDALGLGGRSTDLRTATGGQIGEICGVLAMRIVAARTRGNMKEAVDAADARDALGALWCVL